MLKNVIIISLLLLVIYLYYQKRNLSFNNSDYQELHNQLSEIMKVNKIFASFCQNEIGGKDIEEIRTKLNGRTLSEILEQNEDHELEVDTLRRSKGELESDLLAQSNSFKSLIKEKESLLQRKLAEASQREGELKVIVKRLEKEKKDLQTFSKKQVDELNQKLEELKKK